MLIPTNFAQVNLKFTGTGVPSGAEMTFGVAAVGSTPDDVSAAVAASWISAGIPALYSSSVELSSILVKMGPNSTGPSAEFPVSSVGTSAAAAVSPNTSMLIKKNTASGGRTNRGRFYMPGVAEVNVDQAGNLDATYLGDAQDAWTDFLDLMVAADFDPVVLHAPDSPGSGVPTIITSLTVDSRVATQRRRLRR